MNTTINTRQPAKPAKPAIRRPMTAAAFCALSDEAKRAHVSKLSANERRALVNAVAAHAGTRAKPSKPTGKSASQQQPATPNPFTREYVASVYAARKAGNPSAPRA